MKFDLDDLVPTETTFQASGKPGKTFTLGRMTLRGRVWMSKQFTPEQIRLMFLNQNIAQISEVAYFLLKEKNEFSSIDDFQEIFSSPADLKALITAMLETIGISQPVIKQIKDQAQKEESDEKKDLNPSPQTGGLSTTPSPASMDIPLTNS